MVVGGKKQVTCLFIIKIKGNSKEKKYKIKKNK